MPDIRSVIGQLSEACKSERCTLGWSSSVIFECEDDEPGVFYQPTPAKLYTHPHNGYVVMKLVRSKWQNQNGRIYGEFDGLDNERHDSR